MSWYKFCLKWQLYISKNAAADRFLGRAHFYHIQVPQWILESNNHLTACWQCKGLGLFFSAELTTTWLACLSTVSTLHLLHRHAFLLTFTNWIWLWANTDHNRSQVVLHIRTKTNWYFAEQSLYYEHSSFSRTHTPPPKQEVLEHCELCISPQTYQQTQPSDQSGMKPVSQQQSNKKKKKIKWYLVSLQPKGHLDTGKHEVNPVS